MKRILAIRTSDREYAEELAKSFNRYDGSVFQTLVFTDGDAYNDYLRENRIDVLLCDEELLDEYIKTGQDTIICGLSEIFTVNDMVKEPPLIFKYQSSEKIMEEIMARYRAAVGTPQAQPQIDRKNTGVYSICSPVGGCYSSTFALGLAKYLSFRGTTLFMSFDPFYILPGTQKDPAGKDLTDVIFYLNGMQPYLMDFIKDLTIKKGRLECVSGVSHWFDLYDISPQNMHDLIEKICKCDYYENIVFDIGIIGAASMEVLLASDRIFVPVRNDHSAKQKIEEWKRQLRYCGREELLEKVREITVPEDEILKGEYSYDNILSGKLGRFLEGGVELL